MKTFLLLMALLVPSLCFAADPKLIDGWIVQTLEKSIILQPSKPINVRDGGKVKLGDVISLEFPKGSPVFADKTHIRMNIDAAGVLTKYTAVDGSASFIYSFQVTDPMPPRVLK